MIPATGLFALPVAGDPETAFYGCETVHVLPCGLSSSCPQCPNRNRGSTCRAGGATQPIRRMGLATLLCLPLRRLSPEPVLYKRSAGRSSRHLQTGRVKETAPSHGGIWPARARQSGLPAKAEEGFALAWHGVNPTGLPPPAPPPVRALPEPRLYSVRVQHSGSVRNLAGDGVWLHCRWRTRYFRPRTPRERLSREGAGSGPSTTDLLSRSATRDAEAVRVLLPP